MSAGAIISDGKQIHIFSDGLGRLPDGTFGNEFNKIRQLTSRSSLLILGLWKDDLELGIHSRINGHTDPEQIAGVVSKVLQDEFSDKPDISQHFESGDKRCCQFIAGFSSQGSPVVFWIDSLNGFEPQQMCKGGRVFSIAHANGAGAVPPIYSLIERLSGKNKSYSQIGMDAFKMWLQLLKNSGAHVGGQIFNQTIR